MRGFLLSLLALASVACNTSIPINRPDKAAALAFAAGTAIDSPPAVKQFILNGRDTVSVAVSLAPRKVDSVPVTIIKIVHDTIRDTLWLPKPDTTTLPSIKGGQRFGPSALHLTTTGVAPFGYTSLGNPTPSALFKNLQWSAKNGVMAKLSFTAGAHSAKNGGPFLRRQCPGYKPSCLPTDSTLMFARPVWDSVHAAFNTKAVRDSVAKYRKWIALFDLMDEPHVSGLGDGNTWGPKGTLTKARVDSLCGVIKQYMPGVPIVVSHQWTAFDTTHSYRVCDGVNSQYSYRSGSIVDWYNGAVRSMAKNGPALSFSINWINGGTQDKDGTWDCKDQGGVKGQSSPNCAMTPAQVKESVLFLGTRTCGGQMMWTYKAEAAVRNAAVLKEIADSLAKVPYKACKSR